VKLHLVVADHLALQVGIRACVNLHVHTSVLNLLISVLAAVLELRR
jgi:hypothetical protein